MDSRRDAGDSATDYDDRVKEIEDHCVRNIQSCNLSLLTLWLQENYMYELNAIFAKVDDKRRVSF